MKSNCREMERTFRMWISYSEHSTDDRKEHVRSQTKWLAKSVIWSGKDKRSRSLHNLQSLLLFIRCYLAIWDSSQMISVLMSMSPAITMSSTGRSKMNDCFVLRQLIKRSLQKLLQHQQQRTVVREESCRLGYMVSLTTTGQTHHSFPRLRVHFAEANHFSNRNMEKVPAAWRTKCEERRVCAWTLAQSQHPASCIQCKARKDISLVRLLLFYSRYISVLTARHSFSDDAR